jgi:hypothetical protein
MPWAANDHASATVLTSGVFVVLIARFPISANAPDAFEAAQEMDLPDAFLATDRYLGCDCDPVSMCAQALVTCAENTRLKVHLKIFHSEKRWRWIQGTWFRVNQCSTQMPDDPNCDRSRIRLGATLEGPDADS